MTLLSNLDNVMWAPQLPLLFSLCIVYLLPTAIAASSRHPRTRIIVALNLLAGWTVIGWLMAFVWSFIYRATKLHSRG